MRYVLLTALLLKIPAEAVAVSCPVTTGERTYIKESFERAENVFSAYVEEIEDGLVNDAPSKLARLRVLQVWKGDLLPGEVVLTRAEETVHLIGDSYVPEPQSGVLIYTGALQPFYLSTCTPTGPLESATRQIPMLNRLSKKKAYRRLPWW